MGFLFIDGGVLKDLERDIWHVGRPSFVSNRNQNSHKNSLTASQRRVEGRSRYGPVK